MFFPVVTHRQLRARRNDTERAHRAGEERKTKTRAICNEEKAATSGGTTTNDYGQHLLLNRGCERESAEAYVRSVKPAQPYGGFPLMGLAPIFVISIQMGDRKKSYTSVHL